MSSHMQSVLKQAMITFACKPDSFKGNLEQLKQIFNKTTSNHVNLNPKFTKACSWESDAPVSYIQIYSNNLINIAIFILKPNTKLPLHNHPSMIGLLKVISGTVRIRSFSLDTPKTLQYNQLLKSGTVFDVVAEQHADIVAHADSDCCELHPDVGNIHEIESVDGPAAFMDILSPPYETDLETRKCSYYRLYQELEPNVFHLQEINTPTWFWCDMPPYEGPVLNGRNEDVREIGPQTSIESSK